MRQSFSSVRAQHPRKNKLGDVGYKRRTGTKPWKPDPPPSETTNDDEEAPRGDHTIFYLLYFISTTFSAENDDDTVNATYVAVDYA